MHESTLTSKGQTTLPKHVRQALNLKPGDKLRYLVLDDGEVRLLRMRPVTELAGRLRSTRAPVTLEEMEEAIAEGAARR
ncbi:type II toxin-antitoxin system PrlF family antitoxin [Thalassococcus sp. S3]|uniref:AbrB/MazE/SpoVT family DNA-binding domain-containing protein n=1 Tax=Thalassococcus sp. S3 TaxID=2017482 RepID=UPI00102455FB|nr:type II toxin-antitoxin system PrlF family antitoxin [Thalassococcus sp. S3]QBF34286.1 AbrB family transcriptional regulator [Thalassococcus sp. S3]